MKTALAAIAIGLTVLVGATRTEAASITLYNGSGDPQAQGELVFGNLGGSQTIGAGPVNLDTTANNSAYAGYSNYNPNITIFPSLSVTPGTRFGSSYNLDRSVGYTLSFTVQIASEVSDGANGANRAGFSVIVSSSDVVSGTAASIELGFNNGRVFAQNVGFTAGEQTSNFNPVGGSAINYNLSVSGSNYQLSANGNSILSGALRDYTSSSGTFNPYRTSNFIFLGDNTSQSRANINLGAVSINTTTAAVPFEFNPTLGLSILGVFATVHHLKNKKK
jgi:hypothetical protein